MSIPIVNRLMEKIIVELVIDRGGYGNISKSYMPVVKCFLLVMLVRYIQYCQLS